MKRERKQEKKTHHTIDFSLLSVDKRNSIIIFTLSRNQCHYIDDVFVRFEWQKKAKMKKVNEKTTNKLTTIRQL